jgi:phytoene dehydrogenase-like protein
VSKKKRSTVPSASWNTALTAQDVALPPTHATFGVFGANELIEGIVTEARKAGRRIVEESPPTQIVVLDGGHVPGRVEGPAEKARTTVLVGRPPTDPTRRAGLDGRQRSSRGVELDDSRALTAARHMPPVPRIGVVDSLAVSPHREQRTPQAIEVVLSGRHGR